MKTLQELLQEKEVYRNNIYSLDEKIKNFDKPTTLSKEEFGNFRKLVKAGEKEKANEYFSKIAKIANANKQELNELKHQKNIYQLAYEMIDVNIITVFETLHKKKILTILNKYVKKRIGEKTEIKIKNELKEIDGNINYVYLEYNNSFTSDNYVYIKYSGFNIEINFTQNYGDSWLNENGELIKDVYNYDTYNYKYIDNILQIATQKVEEKEKVLNETEKEIKAIREKIRNFNNFYCKSEKYFKIDEYNIFR